MVKPEDCNIDIIEHRIGAVEQAVERISLAVQKMAESTAKLVTLEERHAETREGLERAFRSIEQREHEHDSLVDRVMTIEVAMPGLKEVRSWVIRGVLSIIGVIGMAMLMMVTRGH